MEFSEVVRRRRMVRNYTGEPIAADALDRIVDAARRAPSAGHAQGQSFVVVTERPGIARIADLAGEAEYLAKGFDPWISRAGALVVVCVSEAAYHERYSEVDKVDANGNEIDWPVPFWWVDAGAAMMALLYATVAEGLAGGFLGTHALEDLQSELGIPYAVSPIGIVTIGHPAPDRRSSSVDRGRREFDDVVHYERWESSSENSKSGR